MAAASGQALFREKEIWLCGCSERGHATWACAKNHQGSWWHDEQEISSRQEGLPWVSTSTLLCRQLCFYVCSLVTVCVAFCPQGTEIYAPCSAQTAWEHAHALGADQRCSCALPHYRSHFLCKWNPMGYWASVHCSVGVSDSIWTHHYQNRDWKLELHN